MTFCLCVPDCVRAATGHAMDHSGNSHGLECLRVSSGKLKLRVNTRHLIALPGKAVALRLLSWPHFLSDPEATLSFHQRVVLSQRYIWLGMENSGPQGPSL